MRFIFGPEIGERVCYFCCVFFFIRLAIVIFARVYLRSCVYFSVCWPRPIQFIPCIFPAQTLDIVYVSACTQRAMGVSAMRM